MEIACFLQCWGKERRSKKAERSYIDLLGLDLEWKPFHHALGRVAQDIVAEEAHALWVCGWSGALVV